MFFIKIYLAKFASFIDQNFPKYPKITAAIGSSDFF